MMQHTGTEHASAEMEQCIQNCEDCHHICIETLNHCMHMGGKHVEPTHLRLLYDCIQICATSADFMLRGSPFHNLTCGVCAMVCERCAEDCLRIDANDPQMVACADMCRRCAQTCRQMAAITAA
jgi:hypothetical protein